MSQEKNKWIRAQLEQLAEPKYAKFSSGLITGEVHMLGVRIPALRTMAKQLAKEDWREYCKTASDASMEEILLQGMTLGYVKEPFVQIEPYLDAFIPKITNWSICDSTCVTLKVAKKEPEAVWAYLQKYLGSDQEYEIRFGVVMLLDHFINEIYLQQIFRWFDRIDHPGYYVKMAVAWNLATCYAKFPQETGDYLAHCKLDDWTYNKAIRKMLESYRVDAAAKIVLRSQKRGKD